MKSNSYKPAFAIFITICMALCIIPFAFMAFFTSDEAIGNETLPKWPSAIKEDGSFNSNVLKEVGSYFETHYAFRPQLITADAALQTAVFDVSNTDSVVTGTNGWLYYSSTLDDYLGRNGLSERGMFNLAHNLSLIQNYVQAMGAKFIFISPPNKNSLYPENMPYYYSVDTGGSRNRDTLKETLEAAGVSYLDLFELFESSSGRVSVMAESGVASDAAAASVTGMAAAGGIDVAAVGVTDAAVASVTDTGTAGSTDTAAASVTDAGTAGGMDAAAASVTDAGAAGGTDAAVSGGIQDGTSEEEHEVLYLRQDSHWNNKGAMLVYNHVLDALGKEHDSYADAAVSYSQVHRGDLAKMIYPADGYLEEDYQYDMEIRYEYISLPMSSDPVSVEDFRIESLNPSASDTLLMYRDSFGNTLIPIIANAFEHGYYAKSTPYPLARDIQQYSPDYVIIELVERNLRHIAEDPAVVPSPRRNIDPALLTVCPQLQTDISPLAADASYVGFTGNIPDDMVQEGIISETGNIYLAIALPDGSTGLYEAFTITSDQGDYGYAVYLQAGMFGSAENAQNARVTVYVEGQRS